MAVLLWYYEKIYNSRSSDSNDNNFLSIFLNLKKVTITFEAVLKKSSTFASCEIFLCIMSGLRRFGVDANPFGSKYSDKFGGFAAGNGQRTYTKPSYTLFVTGIPDAESSDAVASVFEFDAGFLQCRPVGHKSKRMVFVDYDTIEHATKALQAHQGWKWEPIDEGLKIDYDQDARCKRNTALDLGLYEKFYAIGPRKAPLESESEMFARLKAEGSVQADKKRPGPGPSGPKASKATGPTGGGTLGAKILIRNKGPKDVHVNQKDASKEIPKESPVISESKGLVQYGSSSSEEEACDSINKRAKREGMWRGDERMRSWGFPWLCNVCFSYCVL